MTTSGSTVIRVFLSSTFVDFQEERSLLVKQVFPSLRRRARSRGVDIVDVDLRWGVTAEQTERGETLPLCLAEIDRCRPYFISLLGERYGWVPPADPTYYKPALLERQPWLQERMGAASLTELEILHGVLRNPEMAGHAFFYLRDPIYAQAQGEPGWMADHPAEQQRLDALKEEVRRSGFPVCEGLATPQAIAEQIEADLWAVIEREHPEQEPLDPLQREAQRHSDYRRARTGLYLGGESAIAQLEEWIESGEQRILITGESGSGKSALIANWLEAHSKSAPQDLVHAHHLGCTNDASAVRPMLGRLIDTASQLLLAEQQIAEPLKVPQEWWELMAAVAGTLQIIGRWCVQQGRRWIIVFDGLDRLAQAEQQALPWIPTTIPPGIVVVASALDCPARTILQDRQYHAHEIGPLGSPEQQQLIERCLSRYTKQLESGLQQKILAHKLAGSPLFLKVLLEELRQCAWHDTLAEQLEFYLAAEAIDGLFAKVLERLEGDGLGDATRKALTTLWASRVGLSETELLDITRLAPLEWMRVGLALSEALGRNGEQIVFDNEYLRIAVHDRYLPNDIKRTAVHLELANYFFNQIQYDERTCEELPWQWLHARDWRNLWHLFCAPRMLIAVYNFCGLSDVARLWKRSEKHLLAIHSETLGKRLERVTLAELLESSIQDDVTYFEEQPNSGELLIAYFTGVADLCEAIDIIGYMPMRARVLAFEISRDSDTVNERRTLDLLGNGIKTLIANCDYTQARELCEYQISRVRRINGSGSKELLECLENMFTICHHLEDNDTARTVCAEMMHYLGSESGDWSSKRLDLKYHQCVMLFKDRRFPEVICELEKMLETSLFLGEDLGRQDSIITMLAQSYGEIGNLDMAADNARKSLAITRSQYGTHHQKTIHAKSILAAVHAARGDHHMAKSLYYRCLEQSTIHFGERHAQTHSICSQLANLLCNLSEFESAIPLVELALRTEQNYLSKNLPDTLALAHRLAEGLYDNENLPEARRFFRLALTGKAEELGGENASTMESLHGLACCLSALEEYSESISLRRLGLDWCEQEYGAWNSRTLCFMHELGLVLKRSCELQEAEVLFRRSLTGNEQANGVEHPNTLSVALSLAELLSATGRPAEAIPLRRRELAWCRQNGGDRDPGTLTSINELAIDLRQTGELQEAETLFRELVAGRQQVLEASDFGIGRALGGLAETLKEADKLEEAAAYALQALNHRLEHEGPDAWWTNRERLDLGLVLQKLGRDAEVLSLMDQLQASLNSVEDPCDADRQLLAEADALLTSMGQGS